MPVQATQAAAVSWQSPEPRAVWSSGAHRARLASHQKAGVPPPVPCGGRAGVGEQGAASSGFFCDTEKVN